MKQLKKIIFSIIAVLFALTVISCTTNNNNTNDEISIQEKYHCIDLTEAKNIAERAGSVATNDKYNIYGIIVSVNEDGGFTISDEDVEFYVNGIKQVVGKEVYIPETGDEVVLKGSLVCLDGVSQMDKATLVELVSREEDEPVKPSIKDNYNCITIAEALRLAEEAGSNGTAESYYVYGVIKKIENTQYGAMTIADETGELYVYGTYAKDGTTRYDAMEEKPVAGDEVVLYGILKTYGETKEMDRGYIQEFAKGEGVIEPDPKPNPNNKPTSGIDKDYNCITIAEALRLAAEAGDAGTAESYYVYGIITEVSNSLYGAMTIADETGELYIYGTYSKDGTTRYDAMEERPVRGDEVVLYGKLKSFNGSQEMDRGYIQVYHHEDKEIDVTGYNKMTVDAARDAKKEEKVLLTGVVAQMTYAFGQVPSGFYLVDNSGSIYVYGKEIAGNVKVGNTVTVAGVKTYYVLADEQSSAQKHGYQGCCQIDNAILVENDKGNSDFDKSWIEETTVKEIMNTSVTENITTNIYKVTAHIKKVIGTGFTNYYINDLDGVTGSYVYTQCSGSDFAWLDEFDGKICTVYLSAINAKSSSSGCVFRFLPVAVSYDNFVFDQSKGAEFAIEYYAADKFLPMYEADPMLEVVTSASNELINLGEVAIRYSSSDKNIGYFEEVDGKTYFHTNNAGTVIVTITAEYNGVEVSREVVVEVVIPTEYDTLTVKEAINTADDTEVIVRGVVASSLVNQDGFYLIDETGIIAVTGIKEDISLLSSGDEVVVKGIKDHKIKDGFDGPGQINIYNAEILVNYYGNHEYATNNFIHGKTVEDIYALNYREDHSNEVYVVDVVIEIIEQQHYSSLKVSSPTNPNVKLTVYCSSAGQYSFLKAYNGQTVKAEVAVCNWNSKTYYATCIMAIYTESGKIINTLNFNE